MGSNRSGDTVQVHWKKFKGHRGYRQASLCVRQLCVSVLKISVRKFLRRTGGTVERAGVRWRAGLLLVLWRAVRLQRRHGCRRVLALGRATFAAEQLAFDFPEVVAVVKSERGSQKKKKSFNRNLPNLFKPLQYRDADKDNMSKCWSYPSSSPALMFSLAKKAMCGKRRSWCVVNTRHANKLGSHMWLRKRLMFP